jgi:Na+/melibiose symporter-like transporter
MTALTVGGDLGPAWIAAAMLVLGVALLRRFVRHAHHRVFTRREPLLDLDLLRDDGPFRRGLIATCSLYAGISAFYFSVTLYLQAGLKYSAWQTGSAMTPLALGFVIASMLTGKLSAANRRRSQVAGCLVMAASLLAAIAVAGAGGAPSLAVLGTALAFYGIGQGAVTGSLISDVVASIRAAAPGAASGLLLTTQQVAGATGVALVQKLMTLLAAPEGAANAYGLSFEAAGLVLALLAVVTSVFVARAGGGTHAHAGFIPAEH